MHLWAKEQTHFFRFLEYVRGAEPNGLQIQTNAQVNATQGLYAKSALWSYQRVRAGAAVDNGVQRAGSGDGD